MDGRNIRLVLDRGGHVGSVGCFISNGFAFAGGGVGFFSRTTGAPR